MNTFRARAPGAKGPETVDRHVGLLLEHWERAGEVSLPQFWRNCKADRALAEEDELEHLGTLIKTDLRCRIERGISVEVKDYIDRFPELHSKDNRVLSLIYEEFCAREDLGELPDVEDFYQRYAPWKNSLVWQLQLHQLFNAAEGENAPGPRFPEAGEDFEEYQLLSSIGRGGSSQVFLASDRSLGGKRVVLKISPDQGQEPKTQGVLDHPHIVPVNSVAFDLEAGLRGLSMPFRPGLPLDEVVKRVEPAKSPRRAMDLWNALFRGDSPCLSSIDAEQLTEIQSKGPTGDGWAGFPRSGSYVHAAAWTAMILARALQYAHGMSTIHRDVKPGNVLLTFQHGPQLLDFNLAESPYVIQHAKSAVLGGTLPYMAPEQIEAFLDPEQWGRVGARSDIYSLGLVLRELLTGQAPEVPDTRRRLPSAMRSLLDRRRRLVTDVRQFVPAIPYALQAIVKRCLCFRPEDRYPSAQALAEDLDRFLNRRPLVVASNPSRCERLRNWTARNRRGLATNAMYLSVIGILAFQVVPPYLRPALETRPEFRNAKAAVDEKRYHDAIEPLRKLVSEYPENLVGRLYLGISEANTDRLIENEAQVSLRQVVATPGAEDVLVDWASLNPKLSEHLFSFAEAQVKYVGDHKTRKGNREYLSSGGQNRESDDKATELKYWDTIHHVLAIGLRIAPHSADLHRQMALAEEALGQLDSACQRLTTLIDQTRALGEKADHRKLINWIVHRSRIATRRSAELRALGSPADLARAMALLEQSRDALDRCKDTISVFDDLSSSVKSDKIHVYNYLWFSTETWLALGLTEQLLGQEKTAAKAFKNANQSLNRLDLYGRATLPEHPPQFETLKKRVGATAIGPKTASN